MLQELQYLFDDRLPQVFTASVLAVEDGETDQLLVHLKALPEGNELVAPVAWSPGLYEKPKVGDIAVVVLVGKEVDHPQVLSFLPRTDTGFLIPQRALDGQLVLKSRAGQKVSLSSDTRVNIGKGGDTEESEPLVLGLVLKSCLTDLTANLGTLIDHVTTIATQLNALAGVVTSLGGTNSVAAGLLPATGPTGLPALKTKITSTDKEKYLTTASTNIVSQVAFTERGS